MASEHHSAEEEKTRLSGDEELHEQAPRTTKDKIGLWLTVFVAIAFATWLALRFAT
jgi:hypothetical protein